MNASLLRTVLALAIVLGVGVIANIFANQHASGRAWTSGGAGLTAGADHAADAAKLNAAQSATEMARGVQQQLVERGYLARAGDLNDAAAMMLVKAAILAFQFDYHLGLTAEPSGAVLKALIFTHAKLAPDQPIAPETVEARALLVEVQRALAHLGYGDGEATGALDDATRAAIAKFERARGLQASGRVSAPLIESLGPAFDGARLLRSARGAGGGAG